MLNDEHHKIDTDERKLKWNKESWLNITSILNLLLFKHIWYYFFNLNSINYLG